MYAINLYPSNTSLYTGRHGAQWGYVNRDVHTQFSLLRILQNKKWEFDLYQGHPS